MIYATSQQNNIFILIQVVIKIYKELRYGGEYEFRRISKLLFAKFRKIACLNDGAL